METCPATHISPTGQGDITVRCALGAGHQPAEDHEGWVGVFPVRWRETQPPPSGSDAGSGA